MLESHISEDRAVDPRPWPLVVAASLELLLGVFCAATSAYLFLRSSLAKSVVAVVALIAIASAVGLFRRAKIGWWIAVISNLLFATTLFWDAFSEHYIDVEEIVAGTFFVALTALLLLNATRRRIFERTNSAGE